MNVRNNFLIVALFGKHLHSKCELFFGTLDWHCSNLLQLILLWRGNCGTVLQWTQVVGFLKEEWTCRRIGRRLGVPHLRSPDQCRHRVISLVPDRCLRLLLKDSLLQTDSSLPEVNTSPWVRARGPVLTISIVEEIGLIKTTK